MDSPIRNFEERKDLRRDLNQQPRHHRIRDCNLVNVAPLQFGEEVVDLHRGSSEKIRVTNFLNRGSRRSSSVKMFFEANVRIYSQPDSYVISGAAAALLQNDTTMITVANRVIAIGYIIFSLPCGEQKPPRA